MPSFSLLTWIGIGVGLVLVVVVALAIRYYPDDNSF
jgi:hypothetical protein